MAALQIACRTLQTNDFADAFALYVELVGAGRVADVPPAQQQFETVINHPGTTLWGAEHLGQIVAMATLHVLPNVTYSGRPYALVENVVTRLTFRGQGFGRAVMMAVVASAWAQDAYKIMLLTGKGTGAAPFYEKLGFTADEKHAMTLRRVPARI